MAKTLILIRHGHRDTSRREMDNGLTEKGREQARSVRRFFAARFTPEEFHNGLWIVSSPKVRCVETLQPTAKLVEGQVDIHPGLDEQGARESRASFEDRVHGFLQEWSRSPAQLTVLASHGDWLPIALFHLVGLVTEPRKGSWTELESVGNRAVLKWALPSFKPFYS